MTSPNAVGQDMGWRFEGGDWSRSGGNFQSLLFYHEIYDRVFRDNPYTQDTIHDYGCAEGDGTALLHALLPAATICGFDITPKAVMKARARWLTNYDNYDLDFAVGDATRPEREADVIMSSHTLEHVTDPVAAVRNQLAMARKRVIVLVPPIVEGEVNGGHDGAMTTAEFYRALRSEFGVNQKWVYNTIRPHPDKPGQYLQEGNILMEIVK